MSYDDMTYVLCLVKNNVAYFTNIPLIDQTGKGWSDVPYSTHAELPDPGKDSQIIRVSLGDKHPFTLPSDEYSVNDINSGAVAWLSDFKNRVFITAGTELNVFLAIIKFINSGMLEKQMKSSDKNLKERITDLVSNNATDSEQTASKE